MKLLKKYSSKKQNTENIHEKQNLKNMSCCNVFVFLITRMFSCTGEEVSRLQFPSGGNYSSPLREGSFDMFGDRVIKLGTNM